jgi:FkbM family methyltransferase
MIKTIEMGPFVLKIREGYSDEKTFNEVIGKNVYQRKNFKILPGEKWMDCGGNVGAFAVLASRLGAKVTTFEPCPENCKMIEENLRLNGLDANIVNAALVPADQKFVLMHTGANNQVWRNSIYKKWRGGKSIKVKAINFDRVATDFNACKMDIEGAEMPILESSDHVFDKLVYEWSLDIDRNLERLWRVYDKQIQQYSSVFVEKQTATAVKTRAHNTWQSSWFPACTNVFCLK